MLSFRMQRGERGELNFAIVNYKQLIFSSKRKANISTCKVIDDDTELIIKTCAYLKISIAIRFLL